MVEQDLDIVTNGDYKNINLKTKINKATGDVVQGISVGNHIIVEKIFAEGREVNMGTYKFYSCGVKYKDEDVTFTCSEKEHEAYAECGGIDDKVKISVEQIEYTFKGQKKNRLGLVFEAV